MLGVGRRMQRHLTQESFGPALAVLPDQGKPAADGGNPHTSQTRIMEAAGTGLAAQLGCQVCAAASADCQLMKWPRLGKGWRWASFTKVGEMDGLVMMSLAARSRGLGRVTEIR